MLPLFPSKCKPYTWWLNFKCSANIKLSYWLNWFPDKSKWISDLFNCSILPSLSIASWLVFLPIAFHDKSSIFKFVWFYNALHNEIRLSYLIEL